jgi:hypothetical protein
MENQKRTIAILKQKLASRPNDPKAPKWKKIIADTERDSQVKSNRSSLTKTVKKEHKNVLDVETERVRKEYMHTVLYPDDYSYRMPDELTQPTSMYRSLREFTLTANIDGSADSGRFSFAVKPILGNISDVHQFQTGIVDNTTAWPADFTSADSYIQSNLGSNPRIDPMVLPLTGLSPGFYQASANLNYTATSPGTYVDGFFSPGFANSGDLPVKPIVTSLTSIPITSGFTGVYTNNNLGPTVSVFSVPTGTYYFSPVVDALSNWSVATINKPQIALFAFTKDLVNVGTYVASSTVSVITGVFSGQVNEVLVVEDGIAAVQQKLTSDERVLVNLDSDYLYGFGVSIVAASNPNLATGFTLISTADSSLTSLSNSGSMIKMRPIACACLVTCTLPEINAGGNIVAYSAPPSDIDNYYYETSSQIGPLQLWENLARLNKGELLHDGNFKDGAYVWTQPWDKNDTLMRPPTIANRYGYQGLIVSGQVSPSVGLTGNVVVGRIRIAILYEYLTDSRLYITESCFGSTADLDWVLSYLGSQKHASENADHLQRIRSIISQGAKFMSDSIPSILRGVQTAGKIAALLV